MYNPYPNPYGFYPNQNLPQRQLREIYTPPQDMLDKWDADHKKYIEKAAWIKQMLSM